MAKPTGKQGLAALVVVGLMATAINLLRGSADHADT